MRQLSRLSPTNFDNTSHNHKAILLLGFSNQIGIMQGRLLPKFEGRYQAHPVGYWHEEFDISRELGLDLIEFIFDFNGWTENPLLTSDGRCQIKKYVRQSGVKVETVCADFFMINKLTSRDERERDLASCVLISLLSGCDEIGVKNVVLPLVDSSSIQNLEDEKTFIELLRDLEDDIKEFSCGLSLETDFEPARFAHLLEQVPLSICSVNYDSGNSASLGFDMREEFEAYGELITDLHVKDRAYLSGPTLLGEGDVDFILLKQLLIEFDYKGPIIFQAYRDETGVEIFEKQLKYFEEV